MNTYRVTLNVSGEIYHRFNHASSPKQAAVYAIHRIAKEVGLSYYRVYGDAKKAGAIRVCEMHRDGKIIDVTGKLQGE